MHRNGAEYVALQAPAMLLGCAALVAYAAACGMVAKRRGLPIWAEATLAYSVWLVLALGAFRIGVREGLFR